MSTVDLTHTCPTCGAVESLDVVLARSVDDDEMRRLVGDLLTTTLPVGREVIRYLRLFTPAKQRLRAAKARQLLGELVLDMKRCSIERKGRRWAVGAEDWRAGFEIVFEAAEKGTLRPPLKDHAYLYEVLLRRVDAAEAKAENQREANRRHAPHAVRERAEPEGAAAPAQFVLQTVPGPQGPSRHALEMRRKMGLDKAPTDSQEMPAEPDATKGSEA